MFTFQANKRLLLNTHYRHMSSSQNFGQLRIKLTFPSGQAEHKETTVKRIAHTHPKWNP